MKPISPVLAAVLAGLTFATAAPQASAQTQAITGAGSSLAAPIYAKWGGEAKQAVGVELNYQSIGSGAGLNSVVNRTVDFGASDAPVLPAKLTSANLLQFPSVMGAVVMAVNVPGIKQGALKLTGPVIAEIYLGHITKWNDKRIAALNHGMKLPSVAIAPVYRADASGTTYVFTTYLSTVDPTWKTKVGAATSVKWPVGNGANNSNGVAAAVRQFRGAITYVEYAYAAQNNIPTTLLQNHDGKFLQPTMQGFQAAAAAADWAHAQNFAVNILNEPGADSWPIVTPTFVLIPRDAKDPTKTAAVMKFFDWAYKNGGEAATSLDFIPLPAAVQAQVRQSWASIKGANGAPVFQ